MVVGSLHLPQEVFAAESHMAPVVFVPGEYGLHPNIGKWGHGLKGRGLRCLWLRRSFIKHLCHDTVEVRKEDRERGGGGNKREEEE